MGDYYKQGTWNALCAICGFEYKSSELRWNSQINDYVCKQDWEVRHPQERLRAVKDDQSVPWTRSDPSTNGDRGDADVTLVSGTDDISQLFATDLTANRTITLSTTGASNGDVFQVNRTGFGDYSLSVGGLFSITKPVSFGYARVRFDGSSWVLDDSGVF